MNDIRCPNCNAALSVADLAEDWCENCGKKIPTFIKPGGSKRTVFDQDSPVAHPEAPIPENQAPTRDPTTRPRMDPMRRRQLIGLAICVIPIVGVILYFNLRQDAEVFVDNGGKQPLDVLFDESHKFTVMPGQARSFSCWSGSHRLTVKNGEKVVFDETKVLEGGRSGRRNYLLNPEATNRYRVRKVEYGLSVPNFQTYYGEDDKYQIIAGRVQLAPVSAWIDAKPDHVLEKPPSSVKGKFSDSRIVLVRIPLKDYDLIAAAKNRTKVTSEDTSLLDATVTRVLKEDE